MSAPHTISADTLASLVPGADIGRLDLGPLRLHADDLRQVEAGVTIDGASR